MGTEEQIQTAKGLIEEFLSQQTSGLSCLQYSIFAILISFISIHSKNMIVSFVFRLFVRRPVSLQRVHISKYYLEILRYLYYRGIFIVWSNRNIFNYIENNVTQSINQLCIVQQDYNADTPMIFNANPQNDLFICLA